MKLKRLLYLAYYARVTDIGKLMRFTQYAQHSTARSKAGLWSSMVLDSLRFNISFLEYFQFGFYQKQASEKATWAGTGTMFEYQRIMNPMATRSVLDDKRQFGRVYRDYLLHQSSSLDELKADRTHGKTLLENPSGRIVLKVSNGKCGRNVEISEAKRYSVETLLAYMECKGYDVAEAYIIQHAEMSRLSPSGVNTVRVITQLDAANHVAILGCRQRISVDSPVDNMAAGNIAAAIDEDTGIISSKAYFSDITRPPVDRHPTTGVALLGFQVPCWPEILALVKSAALVDTRNRSIGWDVVVTDRGPGLIEGNHDWCKLVWQLPVQQGLKPVLDRYLAEHQRDRRLKTED